MDRRTLFLGLATMAGPSASRAQSPVRRPIVGFVGFASTTVDNAALQSFRQALEKLGHTEGRTIVIEARSSEGDVNRGHALISELAALPVDVFFTPGPAATRAIARMSNIPVVAVGLPATANEPELFSSLARPGGTVTGFSAFGEEMSAKRIEMLKQVLPRLKVLGVMHNVTDPTFQNWGEQTISDARKQGLEPLRLGLTAASAAMVADNVRKLREAGGAALIVIRDFLTSALMDDICKIGAEAGIAVIGEHAAFSKRGALLSYGADFDELFRQAAGYVNRILKGEKAADLPIQLPTKFELSVNLKTARNLNLEIPPLIVVRADVVFE